MDSNRYSKNDLNDRNNEPKAQPSHDFKVKNVLNLLQSWEPNQLFEHLLRAQAAFDRNFPSVMQTAANDLATSSASVKIDLTHDNAQPTPSVSVANNNNLATQPSTTNGRPKRRKRRETKRRCLNKPPELDIDDDTLVSKEDGKELTQQELDTLQPGPKTHPVFKRHKELTIDNKITKVIVDEEAVTYVTWLNQYIWVLPNPSHNYEMVYVDPQQYQNIKSCGSSAPQKAGQKYYYGSPPVWVIRISTYVSNYDKYSLPKKKLDTKTRQAMAKQLGLDISEQKSKKSESKRKHSPLAKSRDTLFSQSPMKKSSMNKQQPVEASTEIQPIEQESVRQQEAYASPPLVLEPLIPVLPLTPYSVRFHPSSEQMQEPEDPCFYEEQEAAQPGSPNQSPQ